MRAWLLAVVVAAFLAALAAPPSSPADPPTWAKDVGPLVHRHCTPCHFDDGPAPFTLSERQDVVRRWELVRQVMLSRQMPPVRFHGEQGAFSEVPALTDAQIVMLQDWDRAGKPAGGEAPPAPKPPSGFRLGKPDLVLAPKSPPSVPTEGNPVWRSVLLDLPIQERVRVQGFDIVPKSPKSVRHVLLGVASGSATEGPTSGTLDDRASRLIGAWALGYPAFRLPHGVSMTLMPGERLVAQVLYQTTGKQEDTSFELGLTFSRGNADREAAWVTREDTEFSIPAYREVARTTSITFEEPGELLAVLPEARFFAYVVTVKLGERTLLETVQWNPYWNGSFVFQRPIALAAGSTLTHTTVYENELHTAINEGNRPRLVHSGPALDQEVCRIHYLLAPVESPSPRTGG